MAGALRFSYKAGATPGNTILMDANDSAKPIDLEGANFDELLAKSNLYVGPRCPTAPERAESCRSTHGHVVVLLFSRTDEPRQRPVSVPRVTTGRPGRRARVAILQRGGRGEA